MGEWNAEMTLDQSARSFLLLLCVHTTPCPSLQVSLTLILLCMPLHSSCISCMQTVAWRDFAPELFPQGGQNQ